MRKIAMMIGPEVYYEFYLKGKNEKQKRKEFADLKRMISKF